MENKCQGEFYQNQLGYQSICVTDEKICLVGLDNEKVDCYLGGTTEYYNMLVKIQKLKVDNKQDQMNELVEDVIEAMQYITKFSELAKKVGFVNAVIALFSKKKRQDLKQNGFNFCFWCRY